MNSPASRLHEIANLVESLPPSLPNVVSGFDGFVDEMISLVDERQSLDSFVPVRDIAAFGNLISAAAGHSSLREIVVNAVHPGGCAVNLGDGLAALGVAVDCFATLGHPIHPAFADLVTACRSCHSWGSEPGRTLAFEFADGKFMFSAVRQLADFTAAQVEGCLKDGAYLRSCQTAGVIALTDWTLYPHMTDVWRLLQERVFARLKHRPHFFVDLVDPSSRSAADIRTMLEALSGFENAGPVSLGLNGNEANLLARILDLTPASDSHENWARLARDLRIRLRISAAIIHKPRFAVVSTEDGEATVESPYCENPLKSTGAGDRFNAGYILGLLAGADAGDCLTLGCASSGFFVRQARSGSRKELAQSLREWSAIRA
jgi:sugar/nucleoside kinase (ribokinase family)